MIFMLFNKYKSKIFVKDGQIWHTVTETHDRDKQKDPTTNNFIRQPVGKHRFIRFILIQETNRRQKETWQQICNGLHHRSNLKRKSVALNIFLSLHPDIENKYLKDDGTKTKNNLHIYMISKSTVIIYPLTERFDRLLEEIERIRDWKLKEEWWCLHSTSLYNFYGKKMDQRKWPNKFQFHMMPWLERISTSWNVVWNKLLPMYFLIIYKKQLTLSKQKYLHYLWWFQWECHP